VAAKCALLAEVAGTVRYNHLLALQNASAKLGGVMALKSASAAAYSKPSFWIVEPLKYGFPAAKRAGLQFTHAFNPPTCSTAI